LLEIKASAGGTISNDFGNRPPIPPFKVTITATAERSRRLASGPLAYHQLCALLTTWARTAICRLSWTNPAITPWRLHSQLGLHRYRFPGPQSIMKTSDNKAVRKSGGRTPLLIGLSVALGCSACREFIRYGWAAPAVDFDGDRRKRLRAREEYGASDRGRHLERPSVRALFLGTIPVFDRWRRAGVCLQSLHSKEGNQQRAPIRPPRLHPGLASHWSAALHRTTGTNTVGIRTKSRLFFRVTIP